MSSSILTLRDKFGDIYFSFNVSTIPGARNHPRNITSISNITSFISETLPVTHQHASAFNTDLTARDDLLIAILSLLFLIVLDALITALLLRSPAGRMSSFSFSIKHFIDLVRDFRIPLPVRRASKRSRVKSEEKMNKKLLGVAAGLLAITIGLEITLLVISTPTMKDVTNRMVAFSIEEVVIPDWNLIRANIGSAMTRPCNALKIQDVDQGKTRLSACVWSTGARIGDKPFEIANDEVQLSFVSNMHDFGGEHYITIGQDEAHFSSRVYFNLGDNRRKMLNKRARFYNREERVYFMHRQFVAYLFSYYRLQTGDETMNKHRLSALAELFNSTVAQGEDVIVLKLGNQPSYRLAATRSYRTTVTGILPRGPQALRFAGVVLKASTAVAVQGPDLNDLDMGSGSTWPREALMWRESTRDLNWLSLLLLVLGGSILCILIRVLYKPIGTTELAAIWGRKVAGGVNGIAPVYLDSSMDKEINVSGLLGTPVE